MQKLYFVDKTKATVVVTIEIFNSKYEEKSLLKQPRNYYCVLKLTKLILKDNLLENYSFHV